MVRARGGGEHGAGRRGDLRDRSRALPRSGALRGRSGGARSGCNALGHGGHRARPDRRAAGSRAARGQPLHDGRVHDRDRGQPGGGAHVRRPASQPRGRRARARAVVDRGTGGASRPRHLVGGGRAVPGACRRTDLPARGAPRAAVRARRQPAGAVGAVGERYLGRLADRPRHHSRHGRPAQRPAAPRGASLLAAQGDQVRPGDPQCQGAVVHPGAAGHDHRDGDLVERGRQPRDGRRRVYPPQRHHAARGRRPAARDGAHPRGLRRRRDGGDRRRHRPPAHGSGAHRTPDAADVAHPPPPLRRFRHHRRRRQRLRRAHAAARLRHRRERVARAAGTVGERHRESARRILRHGARRRVHVGGEQLLLSAHPVVQRPSERSLRRGALPAGRGHRAHVDADSRTDRRARGAGRIARVPRRARARPLHLQPHAPRDRHRAHAGRARGRPGEDLAAAPH